MDFGYWLAVVLIGLGLAVSMIEGGHGTRIHRG